MKPPQKDSLVFFTQIPVFSFSVNVLQMQLECNKALFALLAGSNETIDFQKYALTFQKV